jgi:hypothetical protein
MPRQSLDAPEDLPKQAVRQVTFGKLQGEVPGMPDEASARLEQPLLEAREGPALDGDRQNQPESSFLLWKGLIRPKRLRSRHSGAGPRA